MRNAKIFAVLTSMMIAFTLAGCADGSSSSSSKADVLSASSALESEPEMSYYEQCESKLTELAPDEILEERDGVVYPKFEKHTYFSSTAGRDTNVNVLLPASYSKDKQYPVLYILHGYWNNENWMTTENVGVSTMLTNLVADGEAEEMIVVCPYIYCSKEQEYCTNMDTENTLAYDNFINDLMTDLMPYIEQNFSVKTGRENTAITGFSMGARESLFIGFTYPDKFGYIGSVCTAPGVVNGTGYPYNLEKEQFCLKDDPPLLLLLSAAVNDGVVGSTPTTYHNMLTDNGTPHLWHTMNGTGHDASSVTPHLYNFIRMIFKS
ncbi:MAG: esterase family protein [Ruminococcus sp.]|nr:esterase family protein [Ruminococcus sp.]